MYDCLILNYLMLNFNLSDYLFLVIPKAASRGVYATLKSRVPPTEWNWNSQWWCFWTKHNILHRYFRPVETGGAGVQLQLPLPPPRFLLTSIFDEPKIKWKIAQSYKTSWNSSKFIDIYYIIIDLDTRDGILPVMNSERFSNFQPFTHYSNTQDTTHARGVAIRRAWGAMVPNTSTSEQKKCPTNSVSNIRDIVFYGCSETIKIDTIETRNFTIFAVYVTTFWQFMAAFHIF